MRKSVCISITFDIFFNVTRNQFESVDQWGNRNSCYTIFDSKIETFAIENTS